MIAITALLLSSEPIFGPTFSIIKIKSLGSGGTSSGNVLYIWLITDWAKLSGSSSWSKGLSR